MSIAGISAFSPASIFSKLGPVATPARAKAQTALSSSASNGTSSSTTDGTSIGSTFLNLLVKELQNQDPTAPMDSTAMVGQMISLNQLDQLIGINQALTPPTGSTTSGAASGSLAPSSSLVAARTALLSEATNPSSIESAISAANDPTKPLNLSNFSAMYGGK